MSEPWIGELLPCGDPECDGVAEPEGDTEIRFWACRKCGYELSYERISDPDGSCQLGVPEDVRRRASPPPPVVLQIGRRPE